MNRDLKPNPYIKIPDGHFTRQFIEDTLEYFIQVIIFGVGPGGFNLKQKVVLLKELWQWATKGAEPKPETQANQAAVLRWALGYYCVKIDMGGDVGREAKQDYRESCRIFFGSAREYGLAVPREAFTNRAYRQASHDLLEALLGEMFPANLTTTPMRPVGRREYIEAARVIDFAHRIKEAGDWPEVD